jgi:hypothetical protein
MEFTSLTVRRRQGVFRHPTRQWMQEKVCAPQQTAEPE